MTPAQRQLIKEAYQEGYNEATHLTEEQLNEIAPFIAPIAIHGGRYLLRRTIPFLAKKAVKHFAKRRPPGIRNVFTHPAFTIPQTGVLFRDLAQLAGIGDERRPVGDPRTPAGQGLGSPVGPNSPMTAPFVPPQSPQG